MEANVGMTHCKPDAPLNLRVPENEYSVINEPWKLRVKRGLSAEYICYDGDVDLPLAVFIVVAGGKEMTKVLDVAEHSERGRQVHSFECLQKRMKISLEDSFGVKATSII